MSSLQKLIGLCVGAGALAYLIIKRGQESGETETSDTTESKSLEARSSYIDESKDKALDYPYPGSIKAETFNTTRSFENFKTDGIHNMSISDTLIAAIRNVVGSTALLLLVSENQEKGQMLIGPGLCLCLLPFFSTELKEAVETEQISESESDDESNSPQNQEPILKPIQIKPKRDSTNPKKAPASKKSGAKKQVAKRNMLKKITVKKPETMKKKAKRQVGNKNVEKEPKSGKSKTSAGKLNDNLAEASEKVSNIGKNLSQVSEKFNLQEMNSQKTSMTDVKKSLIQTADKLGEVHQNLQKLGDDKPQEELKEVIESAEQLQEHVTLEEADIGKELIKTAKKLDNIHDHVQEFDKPVRGMNKLEKVKKAHDKLEKISNTKKENDK